MKKVCVVTGTRAEYGILRPLIKRLKDDEEIQLQLVVTGMHLSPEFGLTYKLIEEDKYKIDEKVEILLSSDTSVGIAKSMGLALISFSEVFNRLKPDLLILLGDRYEIFTIASTALIEKIPIAHIHGGELTEGAIDDAMRHSITKMSYLHFTSTEEYRRRVIQLGENPNRVFNVGAMGIEGIKDATIMKEVELKRELNIDLNKKFVLVTYHPETLNENSIEKEINNLFEALSNFDELNVVFTKGNSDAGGRIINKMIDEYAKKNKDRVVAYTSLGQLRYYNAMKYCSMVIGNSSSGIIEAPSFKVPTINIGNRQKGRIQAKSIINCTADKESIINSINKGLTTEFNEKIKNVINPYEGGESSLKIINIIKDYLFSSKKENKKFYDIKW